MPDTVPDTVSDTVSDMIDNVLSLANPISTQIQTTLGAIRLQDIGPIIDQPNRIDIDGYNATKLYGSNPNFNFSMVSKSYDFYNAYAKIQKANCYDGTTNKEIHWGNPGYSKFYSPDSPVNWTDIKPSALPHPTEIDDLTSFTYSFVIDKYTNKMSVRYGKIDNLTELGVNHVIISYNDKIIVSGELGIKKLQSGFVYYININSSKMASTNSKINSFNDKNNSEDTDNFYYILMINTALRLFKAIDSELGEKIQIAPGFNIKYGTKYAERIAQGEKIVKYYDTQQCPDQETIRKYNEFGRTHGIKNACVGFKEGEVIQNIKNENGVLKCEWDTSSLTSYYSKYRKYKQKYNQLKNKQ